MHPRWLVPAVLAAALVTVPADPAPACPFCSPSGETLAGEVAQADFIVYGTLSNAQQDPNDPTAFNKGTTDLSVDLVIKDHEFLKGKKTVVVPKFIRPDPNQPTLKHLIFFKVYDGKLDAYRGEGVTADSKLPDYMKGAIENREKDSAARLSYFFGYLESPELAVSSDAYSEFGYTDYKDIRALTEAWKKEKDAAKAGQLLAWLKDPNTRATRFGLYGLLLGHCGKPDDAKALRALLDDPMRKYSSGLDGVLAGYVLLDPKAGWEYLMGVVGDPKKDFSERYAGLRTVRFFWENRPDVVPNKQVLEAMKVLMAQPDLADLPIEDLRKWKAWGLTADVLGYGGKESHTTIPIVQRSIVKFALAAAAADPADKTAAEFVAAARQKDPKKVEFMESLLKDEQVKPAAAPAKKK